VRNNSQKKMLLTTVIVTLTFVFLCTFFLPRSAPFAVHASGVPNPTPTPTPVPRITSFPNNGISARIILSEENKQFEFTPYLLSIPADSRGVVFVNKTSNPQVIINDDNIYGRFFVDPNKSLRYDLAHTGTYHFSVKSTHSVGVTVIKGTEPAAP
jgi:hypothetical protein